MPLLPPSSFYPRPAWRHLTLDGIHMRVEVCRRTYRVVPILAYRRWPALGIRAHGADNGCILLAFGIGIGSNKNGCSQVARQRILQQLFLLGRKPAAKGDINRASGHLTGPRR